MSLDDKNAKEEAEEAEEGADADDVDQSKNVEEGASADAKEKTKKKKKSKSKSSGATEKDAGEEENDGEEKELSSQEQLLPRNIVMGIVAQHMYAIQAAFAILSPLRHHGWQRPGTYVKPSHRVSALKRVIVLCLPLRRWFSAWKGKKRKQMVVPRQKQRNTLLETVPKQKARKATTALFTIKVLDITGMC